MPTYVIEANRVRVVRERSCAYITAASEHFARKMMKQRIEAGDGVIWNPTANLDGTSVVKALQAVGRLNLDAGEIGPGMLQEIVRLARGALHDIGVDLYPTE